MDIGGRNDPKRFHCFHRCGPCACHQPPPFFRPLRSTDGRLTAASRSKPHKTSAHHSCISIQSINTEHEHIQMLHLQSASHPNVVFHHQCHVCFRLLPTLAIEDGSSWGIMAEAAKITKGALSFQEMPAHRPAQLCQVIWERT